MQNEFDPFSGPVVTIEPGRLERERQRGNRVRRLMILLLLALAAFTFVLWLLVRIQPAEGATLGPTSVDSERAALDSSVTAGAD